MRWFKSSKYGVLWVAFAACAPYAQADISGLVFQDFNGNGSLDSSASFKELGLAGATVKAFAANGAQVGATANSAADGSYTLTGLTAGQEYRLEFSWAESWLSPHVVSNTSVQFVQDGSSSANLALISAEAYTSSTDPYLLIPQYLGGAYNAPDFGNQQGLVVFTHAATATATTQTPPATVKASFGQTGATWGVAYQRSKKTAYASAVIRRHSGLGPLGTGGIYKLDMSNPSAPATGSLNYIDVKTIGIPTGDDPRDGTSCNSVATASGQPAHDIQAALKVGESGIGGISMDNDHERLWLVNMADRKLYAIQNIDPTTTPTTADVLGGYPISLPAGLTCNGEVRPWAVKYHHGKVYVGAVCDAIYGADADLLGIVLRLDPQNPTAGFALEHTFDFKTERGRFSGDWTFPWVRARPNSTEVMPLIGSIEFDLDGSLMVGIIDRASMQMSPENYNSLDCANTDLSHYSAVGDVMRFCSSATGYIQDGTAGCSTNIPSSVYTHNEYYWGDSSSPNNKDGFNEVALGGLAFLTGSGRLVSNGMDPTGSEEGGIFWFDNQTGGDVQRYYIYKSTFPSSGPPDTMAKANGLGDIELISDPAPVEVGNRVWKDTDADGIQDAGEAGIDNVDVVLRCGTQTATVKTTNGGLYGFSTATNASFMQAGEACTLNVAASQAALSSLIVTNADQDGVSDNNPVTDIRDSDASTAGVISFTVGSAGANNHSLDFGYSAEPSITYTAVAGPEAMSCTSDVRLATSVSINGDSQAAGSTGANYNSLVTFDYASSGILTSPFSSGKAGQVGAVWGLAYDSLRKKIYASAFLKRHASFGPNGPGAIYQMDTQAATATPELLIDLAANGVDVGVDPRTPSSGTVDDPDELPIDGTKPSWDQAAFAQIGKVSIGDIDMSADGNTLWAINLKQRELVAVNLINNTVVVKLAIPNPGCSQGDYRPWALKLHLGKAWIGTVCSAEQSQVAADLKAYVQVFDGSSFSNAFDLPLTYAKGNVGNGPGAEKWQPWLASYQTLATNPSFAIYPQPILSDIEFDMDGSIILGFMDRMGHQVGGGNYTPNYPDTSLVMGQTGGDILRVCNNNGVYALENNASCASGSTKGKDNGQGPQGGEYYWGDMYDYNQWNAQGGYHQETSFGGLAFKAGSGEIALTAMNPRADAVAGGVIWLDTSTGGQSTQHPEGVQLYKQAADNPYFGKAAGMGDVEVFCSEPLPDLKLIKAVDNSNKKRGATVIYTLSLTNESTAAATNVAVKDVLPTQLQYVSQVGDGSYDPITGVWTLGNVTGASTKQLTITVTIK